MNHAAAAVRRRAALLWLAVTATALGPVVLAGPAALALVREPAGTFADLLVHTCAAAALVATAQLWLTTADVACRQLRTPGSCRRRVGPVRAALLAACGVAVVVGPASASTDTAGSPPSLAGLPLPDRPTGSGGSDRAPTSSRTVEVRAGDSLWSVAERALGPGAPAADVASYWRRVLIHNADAVGPDPDLVRPGLRLELPPHSTPS